MSDDTESADAVTESTEQDTTETTPDPAKDWQAEAEKWRKLSRDNETRAKANAKANAKLAENEEQSKSKSQVALDRAIAAEQRAAAADQTLARYMVAISKGIPADLVDRLKGETQEEMSADADKLLALIKPAKAEMRADQSQGSRGAGSGAPDMNALLRTAAGRG